MLIIKTFKEHKDKKPGISFTRFDELSRCIVIGDVEPEAMRNGGWNTLAKAERISANKIHTLGVRVIEGVEEIGSRWREEVFNVLPKGIYVLARWVFSNLIIKKEVFHNIKVHFGGSK